MNTRVFRGERGSEVYSHTIVCNVDPFEGTGYTRAKIVEVSKELLEKGSSRVLSNHRICTFDEISIIKDILKTSFHTVILRVDDWYATYICIEVDHALKLYTGDDKTHAWYFHDVSKAGTVESYDVLKCISPLEMSLNSSDDKTPIVVWGERNGDNFEGVKMRLFDSMADAFTFVLSKIPTLSESQYMRLCNIEAMSWNMTYYPRKRPAIERCQCIDNLICINKGKDITDLKTLILKGTSRHLKGVKGEIKYHTVGCDKWLASVVGDEYYVHVIDMMSNKAFTPSVTVEYFKGLFMTLADHEYTISLSKVEWVINQWSIHNGRGGCNLYLR
ncbi:hypothetical protein HDU85_005896 [Gaertneriomyces sp. JEL0708]|nr:hypothetical protein HDU85_005896 [Gaertneriomyces sp. JEL0708]